MPCDLKNKMRRTVWLALFPLLSLLQGEAAQAVLIDRVVAVVGGELIAQSEVDAVKALSPAAADAGILNQMIEKRMFIQEARKKGVRVTEAELERALKDIEERNHFPDREALQAAIVQDRLSWETYQENLKEELTVLKLLNLELSPDILLSDGDIKDYYNNHKERFRRMEGLELLQIFLVWTAQERRAYREIEGKESSERLLRAEDLHQRAVSGADFDLLAKQYSEGPESATGGELGLFKRGELSPEIDQVVFNLKAGEVSPVVKTDQGLHIFKVKEHFPGQIKSLESVQQEIREILTEEKRESARTLWMEALRKRTFVEIK